VVLDGKAYLSRPDRRGGVVNGTSAGADSVTLMVYAHVREWRIVRVTHSIPLATLQDTVAAYGAAAGLPAGGPFPFLVEGTVSNLHWHVIDGRKLPPGPSSHEEHAKAAVRGERRTTKATLLGFYSDHNVGEFLHHDSKVHVHVLIAEQGLAAHVDDVTVDPGALLRLPRVR
jgi:hypothetical protein